MLKAKRDPAATREKLVKAAVNLILRNGYHASGVDAICAEAGVTKGSFFHHFPNKDAIGLAVIAWWSAMGLREYSRAWTAGPDDPLDQLFAMLDIMEDFASRPGEPCVCAIGMMAQETAATHPELRRSCSEEMAVWTQCVADLLKKSKARHRPATSFDPEEVAWFLNSLWQGSMLLAKTREDPGLVHRNLHHARSYVASLFGERRSPSKRKKPAKTRSRKPNPMNTPLKPVSQVGIPNVVPPATLSSRPAGIPAVAGQARKYGKSGERLRQ